jgi:hypothetical protein
MRWMPHSLSQENKIERVSKAQEILKVLRSSRFRKEERILVVVDEKIVYHRSVGNMSSSHAWIGPDGDAPRAAQRLQIERKSMIIVAVTSDGRFCFEVLRKGETINGERYKQFLTRMEHNFRRHVNPLPWSRILLMHDNARPHTCNLMKDFQASKGVEMVKQPAWSPDFNLLDRFVFAALENARVKMDFGDEEDIESFLTGQLNRLCADRFSAQLTLLEFDLEDIITSSGDYLSE